MELDELQTLWDKTNAELKETIEEQNGLCRWKNLKKETELHWKIMYLMVDQQELYNKAVREGYSLYTGAWLKRENNELP